MKSRTLFSIFLLTLVGFAQNDDTQRPRSTRIHLDDNGNLVDEYGNYLNTDGSTIPRALPVPQSTPSTPIPRALPAFPPSAPRPSAPSSPVPLNPFVNNGQPHNSGVPAEAPPLVFPRDFDDRRLTSIKGPIVTDAIADHYEQMKIDEHPEFDPGFTAVQLIHERRQDAFVDRCAIIRDASGKSAQHNFLNAIEGAVRSAMVKRKIETNDDITGPFHIPTPDLSYGVSLISNPLCTYGYDKNPRAAIEQARQSLTSLLGASHIPQVVKDESGKVIEDPFVPLATALLEFSQRSNDLRAKTLNGDNQAMKEFVGNWTQFMSCLGYSESLETTGEPGTKSEKPNNEYFDFALRNYKDSDYQKSYFAYGYKKPKKPEGVQFYLDTQPAFDAAKKAIIVKVAADNNIKIDYTGAQIKAMTPEERKAHDAELDRLHDLSRPQVAALEESMSNDVWHEVGMYQFKVRNTNITDCVDQWNKMVTDPHCKIDKLYYLNALASFGQTFNAWCGMQKVVQSFNVQVNTNEAQHQKSGLYRTDPTNVQGARIASPPDRCVSVAASAFLDYMHFGPLQNTTGKNLGKLLECANYSRIIKRAIPVKSATIR